MRNLIILIFLGLTCFLAGIFTVDERQVAIVKQLDGKYTKLYKTGIHWILPLINDVEFISINHRFATLSTTESQETQDKYSVNYSLLVDWQVTNPLIYLNFIKQAKTGQFAEQLLANSTLLAANYINKNNLAVVNQNGNILVETKLLNELGIKINSIKLQINSIYPIKPQQSSPNRQANLSIESAYYTAQQIKLSTQIKRAQMYQQIRNQNNQFYDYFRKLEIYRDTAKSKSDIPPLNKIYQGY